MKKIFTIVFLLATSLVAMSQSTTVVISQVYGGGGGGTGTYLYDYVELHNVSNTAQSLTGFSLQYGSATGNFGSVGTNVYAFPMGTSIPAGAYLLVQLGAAGTAGVALPVTPDLVTTNLSMSASSGKVALANVATALGCGATATPCVLPAANIIDLVAYGVVANSEGGASVNNGVALTSVQGGVRKNTGCTETNNNNADFDVVTGPVPRNLASPTSNCTTLPVKLEYIKGQKAGSSNNLNWRVTCLSTNIVMEIERAANTRDFKSIFTIAATQERCQQPFDYKDAQPFSGRNYYRLKMIDIDGKISYSPIVGIINGAKGLEMVGLYPSLVQSVTTLSLSAEKAMSIEIFINNMNGSVVKTYKQNIPSGGSLINLDCSGLAPGLYQLSGITGEAATITTRFVKF